MSNLITSGICLSVVICPGDIHIPEAGGSVACHMPVRESSGIGLFLIQMGYVVRHDWWCSIVCPILCYRSKGYVEHSTSVRHSSEVFN